MLSIMQCIRTIKATMKRWELRKFKMQAMAEGTNSFDHAVCACVLWYMLSSSVCVSVFPSMTRSVVSSHLQVIAHGL